MPGHRPTSPRRSAGSPPTTCRHRPTGRLLTAIAMCLILMVGAASAETIDIHEYGQIREENYFEPTHLSHYLVGRINTAGNPISAPFSLILNTNVTNNNASITHNEVPIKIRGPSDNDIYATGRCGYYINPGENNSQIYLHIDTGGIPGPGNYLIIGAENSVQLWAALDSVKGLMHDNNVYPWPDHPYLLGPDHSPLLAGNYVIYNSVDFRHNITYTTTELTSGNIDWVTVNRNIDGVFYDSTVQIYNKNGLVVDNTDESDSVISSFSSDYRPYDIKIYADILDEWLTYTLYDPGDDPGDPSRVMVHIIAQDARNENLLLDAAVEVRDQYDAVVAAGTTSPEGWMVFEYDLPDTLTDEDFDRYYTVSVSLPGWTQKVTNFKFYPAFIPRSGDWIRVEMLPDTDGPADPEKTYIMFFVRDIHANPLERASIEIAGQYWHTNSAGHVAVEVPKNSTTAYTVRKTGHVSISGSAAVGAEGSYVVNIALGPALPDRTPGPGDDPGATPPPRDTRTNEEKGKAVIDRIADNAELIATLAILAAVMGLINLIMPGRRRR